jgi:ATP:ADP antiporter, AAA family
MGPSRPNPLLSRLAKFEPGEPTTAFLLLVCSFLAMASYNIIKPITRSKFIDGLGAENIPYVLLAAGVLIGVIMVGYSWLFGRLPRRWSLPIVQLGIVGLLVGFWFLFRRGGTWVPVAFYLAGLILGILLISQFWTLANLVYDPRQAKRLFGFIGAGAPLGGFAGSLITARYAKQIGSNNLLLVSAAGMFLCAAVVTLVIRRENLSGLSGTVEGEKGVGGRRALELLRKSPHLKTIALVISFAAVGAAIIEQQLNMATAAVKGQESGIAEFLATVQAWMSGIGFLIQILLTSRIHRFLGIGFALLILPVGLGSTGIVMLLNAALWAPGLARVLDQSLRYTVDKTSREILFMPLPAEIKLQAKPFVDVTVDRIAKGIGAVLLLVLIQPWGLHLSWQKLSYASLTMTVLWIAMALRARRGYLEAFRQSIGTREMKPAEIRLATADLQTLETLVEELSSQDERRVLYSIEILESLDKRNLITPLLLYHESSAVRIRALSVIRGATPQVAARWLPLVKRLLTDSDPTVRVAAVEAIADVESTDVMEIVRPQLHDENTRIAMTAAMILARSPRPEDAAEAESALEKLAGDLRDRAVDTRKELAAALGNTREPRFRRLLLPLLGDSNTEVVQAALRSVHHLGDSDFLFIPALVSLLRNPQVKGMARELIVERGEGVLEVLDHFLRDREEHLDVRVGIPSTIARIPGQRSVDILLDALDEPDVRIRGRIIAGLESIRRRQPDLAFRREPVEGRLLAQSDSLARYADLLKRFAQNRPETAGRLLERALAEDVERAADQILSLLGLIYPWKDIAAARGSISAGGVPRAKALEYLDNLLPAALRRRVVPALEQSRITLGPAQQHQGKAWQPVLRELLKDTDPVIASAAVHSIWEGRERDLQPDVEALLAASDGHNWWVFEAASWTVGALRTPEERFRELWLEPFPAVEIAARLSALPVFAGVGVNDLFRIAGAGRQVRMAAGESLAAEGSAAEDGLFLLDGCVTSTDRSGDVTRIDAPAPLNFDEALQALPMRASIRVADPSLVLQVSSAEHRTLLAGSAGMIEGLLRHLCISQPARLGELVVRGAVEGGMRFPSGELAAVDRVLLLESLQPFAGVLHSEMLPLAAIAMERKAAPAEQIAGELDPPTLQLVVGGSLQLESSGDEPVLTAGPGDAVGLYQMLTGIPLVRTVRSGEGCRYLAVDRADLVDLLAYRPDLLRQVLSNLFRDGQQRPV